MRRVTPGADRRRRHRGPQRDQFRRVVARGLRLPAALGSGLERTARRHRPVDGWCPGRRLRSVPAVVDRGLEDRERHTSREYQRLVREWEGGAEVTPRWHRHVSGGSMAARVARLDDLQRRRPWIAFPLGVIYKFLDDQANYLAAIVTYYAFIAVFPLLLIASSVLGFVLQGDATLRDEVLTSALGQFPIVGTQLGRPEGLQGSASAVVVGGLAALYGILGLGQAAQNAVNVVWAIPRNSRLNPFISRLRSFLLLLLAGLTVLVVAVLSSIGSHLDIVGSDYNQGLRIAVGGSAVVLNAVVLALMMRFATSERRGLLETLPGALTVAVLWQVLQLVGGAYVGHVVARASALNGTFALVLGLVALIYIASNVAILGLEVNVVLAKRLYPRALLTPFTDSVQLTEADRRVYTENAQAQRLKGFERVHVVFDGDPSDRPE